MSTGYPGALDSLTNPTASDTMDSVSVPHATQHANANDAIEAIETTLGVNPQGASANVVTRLGAATAAEFGYVAGVTSAIQTQLNTKAPSTSPTLVTPTIGVATATSVNKVAITAPATSATLTLADGATLATVGAHAVTITATADSGVTLPTTGTLATLAGSETFTNKTFTTPVITRSATSAIAASATQTQAAGTALTTNWNSVTTVATAGDAVTLPEATVGKEVVVTNIHATNAIGIFPAVGDFIANQAVDTVYSLAANKTVTFRCITIDVWSVSLSA